MATVEHCLFCFEALAAHLERRRPMTLADIEKAFQEYTAALEAEAPEPAQLDRIKQIPALRRLAASNSESGSSSPSSSSSMSLAAETPATSVTSLATEQPPITESPLFVTWNTTEGGHGRALRGCIGTFEDQILAEGLAAYAITSAMHDTRFDPVERTELPDLEVSVTLLTDFEDCEDVYDWTLGVHGLRISFFYHGRRHGATYLPDVATEQGWTKDETLVNLMRKAGWTGRRDKWREVAVDCVRYQGKKESLEYAEYKQFRDWVVKNKA